MKKFSILFSLVMVVVYSACQQEEVLPEKTEPEQTIDMIGHTNGVPASTIFLTDMPAGYESCFKGVPYLGYCTSHITENKYYIKNNKESDATGIVGYSDDQYAFYMIPSKPLYLSGEYLVPYSISANTSNAIMPLVSSGYSSDPNLGNLYIEYYGLYTLPEFSQATNVVFTIHYKVVK